ncbi:MAG: hypothetical protein ACE363_09345 [Alphaproteobacteria bacterium]
MALVTPKTQRRAIGWACAILIGSTLAYTQDTQARIEGCNDASLQDGDKIVIGSMNDLVGSIGTRRSRAMIAAFEMKFDKARSELHREAGVYYCGERLVRESDDYSASIVEILNDEEVLLEVGARAEDSDLVITYIVVPIRHYAFFGGHQPLIEGYHEALYEKSRIDEGLEHLFRANAELRLMAALALALRYEKLAEAETSAQNRRALMHRSRAFYCDAVGSIDDAAPSDDLLGLLEDDWRALGEFAETGARRLFQTALDDPAYAGGLAVVALERGGADDSDLSCLLSASSEDDQ